MSKFSNISSFLSPSHQSQEMMHVIFPPSPPSPVPPLPLAHTREFTSMLVNEGAFPQQERDQVPRDSPRVRGGNFMRRDVHVEVIQHVMFPPSPSLPYSPREFTSMLVNEGAFPQQERDQVPRDSPRVRGGNFMRCDAHVEVLQHVIFPPSPSLPYSPRPFLFPCSY
jgi:hypothetical protein